MIFKSISENHTQTLNVIYAIHISAQKVLWQNTKEKNTLNLNMNVKFVMTSLSPRRIYKNIQKNFII